MKRLGNFAGLACLGGLGNSFGRMSFSQGGGGNTVRTLDFIIDAMKPKKITGSTNIEIKMLMNDSRRVSQGAVFFASKGGLTDGNIYVEEAAHRGAVAIVSESPSPERYFPAVWIEVENIAESMASAAKKYYDNPDEALNVYAITGTNGKTSVSWIIQHLLSELDEKTGLIGTIHYDLGGRCLPASRTTPDSLSAYAMLNQMRYASCKNVAMEVSSHAISQNRVGNLDIDCACFLNLTQDHIDYHKTMEEYFETKASLFTGATGRKPKCAVLNIDDAHSEIIAKRIKDSMKCVTFSVKKNATIMAEDIVLNPASTSFTLVWPEGRTEVVSRLPGIYNVSNVLAAFACIYSQGKDLEKAAASLKNFKGIPGRMQKVAGKTKFDIFVDYAHTDDALINGLSMLKQIVKGRILVVFGCGGKRDRQKRPKMVAAVQKYASIAWATSDNPRGESITQIFDDMKKGVTEPEKIAFVEDRRRAINLAIDAANDGDCILIAGKGHEVFQELGDTIIPFDDKKIAEELLGLKGLI